MRLLSIADNVVRSMDGIEERAVYVRMRLQESAFDLDRPIIYFYDAATGASIFMQYPARASVHDLLPNSLPAHLRAPHPSDATQMPVQVT